MTRAGSPEPDPDPSVIGKVKPPPFVRLPDPAGIFARRATRFRSLAEGHELKPYLLFLADLSDAQSKIQEGLPDPAALDAEHVARAKTHKMPLLDRGNFRPDAVFDETFKRLLAATAAMQVPEQARAAFDRVNSVDAGVRELMLLNVLAEAIPVEQIAEHVIAAAALQVHFARLAARLNAASLQPIGDGVCPSCGGAPSSTMVVGWREADGTRYCSCSLCSTLWNYIRAQCTLCGSNKKILYQEVEGSPNVKAETCDDCRGYMKVLYQQKDSSLDPVADDVASLGLDLLVRELGFRRGGVNPFLIGY